MSNTNLYKQMALKLPANVRKTILEENFIDKAIYTTEDVNSPMAYLFDAYEEFYDAIGEFDNFYCLKCKLSILTNWKALKPYLEELQNK